MERRKRMRRRRRNGEKNGEEASRDEGKGPSLPPPTRSESIAGADVDTRRDEPRNLVTIERSNAGKLAQKEPVRPTPTSKPSMAWAEAKSHGGFTFGKAGCSSERFTAGPGGEGNKDAVYDAMKGADYIRKRNGAAVPLFKKPALPQKDETIDPAVDSSVNTEDKALAVLSKHSRAPKFSIGPVREDSMTGSDECVGSGNIVHDQRRQRGMKEQLSGGGAHLGPGTYDLERARPGMGTAAKQGLRGKMYHARTNQEASKAQSTSALGVALVRAERKQTNDNIKSGPGAYDTTSGENVLSRTKNVGSKGVVSMAKQYGGADAKPTKQMLRKQYWEAKAADMRETEDGYSWRRMSSTDGRAVVANGTIDYDTGTDGKVRAFSRLSNTTRQPVHAFAPTKEMIINRMNEKELAIYRKRKAEEEALGRSTMDVDTYESVFGEHSTDFNRGVEAQTALEAERSAPNRAYIEPRVKAPVLMARQQAAEESTSKMLKEKPLVASVIALRKQGNKAQDAIYGPNIPMLWGRDTDDRAAMAVQVDEDENEDDEEEDGGFGAVDSPGRGDEGFEAPGSPSQQVEVMLRASEKRRKIVERRKKEELRQQKQKQHHHPPDNETALAFLRSRSKTQGAVIAMQPNEHKLDPRAAVVLAQKKRGRRS